MCGVTITFGCSKSARLVGGSLSKTSRAAPATFPERSASKSAASSTSVPRATLMR